MDRAKLYKLLISLPLIFYSYLSNADTYNGRVKYNYNISNGNVSITFPFDVQEKPNLININPGLNFSSSSQFDSGFGRGWKINGSEEINRCNKNVTHDGVAEKYREFCYNGKRLFLTNGEHLKNGAKYKVEDQHGLEVDYIKSSPYLYTKSGHRISTKYNGIFKITKL